MKANGFISNRIFDVLACGANLVTDEVEGMQEIFGNRLKTYSNAAEFKEALESGPICTADKNEIIAIINKEHTFDHRVCQILSHVHQLINQKASDNRS